MVDDAFRITPGRARDRKNTETDTGMQQVEEVGGQGRQASQGGCGDKPAREAEEPGRLELTLQSFRSELRDTEIDKAMVELVGRQTLYQAAMSATSRVLGLSLANYL